MTSVGPRHHFGDATLGSAPFAPLPRTTEGFGLKAEDYLSDLDGIDATDEQKLELIAMLVRIMASCIELAFSGEQTDAILTSIFSETADQPDQDGGKSDDLDQVKATAPGKGRAR